MSGTWDHGDAADDGRDDPRLPAWPFHRQTDATRESPLEPGGVDVDVA